MVLSSLLKIVRYCNGFINTAGATSRGVWLATKAKKLLNIMLILQPSNSKLMVYFFAAC